MAMKGMLVDAWRISMEIWFLRNLGCLKVVLSNIKMYESVETMK